MDSPSIISSRPRDARQPLFLSVPQSQMPASQFTGQLVHFIGIGGCGMSGLANMLLDCGAIVTGSEPSFNEQTAQLVARGARITRDQLGELLSKQVNLVVRTAAVPDTNIEHRAARALGLRSI